jgi:hypothetical protein
LSTLKRSKVENTCKSRTIQARAASFSPSSMASGRQRSQVPQKSLHTVVLCCERSPETSVSGFVEAPRFGLVGSLLLLSPETSVSGFVEAG